MFRPVEHRHDKIIIVAGGSSLLGFDYRKLENLPEVKTIAVNNAFNLFNADYFCTIDPIPQDKTINQNKGYKYVGYKEPLPNCHMLKRYVCKESALDFMLCEDKDTIQTHNSSYAAFNLAYHMEAKKVLLLGVDADNYNYPPESKGYAISISKIPFLFDSALPQINKRGIEVVNGSLQSRVNCFDKMSIEDGLKWLLL